MVPRRPLPPCKPDVHVTRRMPFSRSRHWWARLHLLASTMWALGSPALALACSGYLLYAGIALDVCGALVPACCLQSQRFPTRNASGAWMSWSDRAAHVGTARRPAGCSRITRGTLELRRQRTELSVLVESSIETARPLIGSKRHALTVQLPEQSVYLNVDPVRTTQVVANMLNNAAKYTDAGGPIRLTAGIRDADFVLAVSDNGIGIPKHDLEDIFAMFSQAQSARERAEAGLGIGLAWTRGWVVLHGGTIKAASSGPGSGSSFTVEIPNACIARSVQVSQPRRRPRRFCAGAFCRATFADSDTGLAIRH